MTTLTLLAVAVMCTMPTGYRRAGFALNKGDNALEVNQNQYEALVADKNLAVTLKDADITEQDKVVAVLGLDLLDAPVELNEIIANIHVMNSKTPLSQKPNCDQFGQLKVNAAQRDQAWAWYQENVVHTELISSEESV